MFPLQLIHQILEKVSLSLVADLATQNFFIKSIWDDDLFWKSKCLEKDVVATSHFKQHYFIHQRKFKNSGTQVCYANQIPSENSVPFELVHSYFDPSGEVHCVFGSLNCFKHYVINNKPYPYLSDSSIRYSGTIQRTIPKCTKNEECFWRRRENKLTFVKDFTKKGEFSSKYQIITSSNNIAVWNWVEGCLIRKVDFTPNLINSTKSQVSGKELIILEIDENALNYTIYHLEKECKPYQLTIPISSCVFVKQQTTKNGAAYIFLSYQVFLFVFLKKENDKWKSFHQYLDSPILKTTNQFLSNSVEFSFLNDYLHIVMFNKDYQKELYLRYYMCGMLLLDHHSYSNIKNPCVKLSLGNAIFWDISNGSISIQNLNDTTPNKHNSTFHVYYCNLHPKSCQMFVDKEQILIHMPFENTILLEF